MEKLILCWWSMLLEVIIKHERPCLTTFPNRWRKVNIMRSGVFLMLQSWVFDINISSIKTKDRHTWVRGLVPTTHPCNKSWGQVPLCELAIFASKSSHRGHLVWPLWLVPCIQTSFNFGTSPCNLFLKRLHVNCLWDKSQRPVPSCKLFRGLVAGTSHRD